jgi:ABC-type transport system involved in multi-copper enzyme maturation permease subunit
MLWTIASKELLENLKSFRFTSCFLLCTVLFVVSGIVSARDYRDRLRYVTAEEDKEKETLAEIRVYSHLKPVVYRRPGPLSVFNQGYERTLGPGVKITHRQIPYLAQKRKTDNPYLDIIPPIDFTTVTKVILSLLAVLLSFDAVSGEKEAGTLRLLLSNPISRPTLLLGKYLGSMMTLVWPLCAGFCLGIVVFVLFSPVAIVGLQWIGLLIMGIASLVYLSVFLLLGLFVSSLTRRPATSLIVLLAIWLFMVVIVPNLGAFIASQTVESPSELERQLEVAQLEMQVEERVIDFEKKLEPSQPMGELTVYGMDGEVLVRLGRPERYSWLNEYYSYRVEQWMTAADLIWERNNRFIAGLRREAQAADAISRISPAFLYEKTCQVLAGTDLESYESFIGQTREYRAQLIEYIRQKNGYTSRTWFTDDPPGQEPFVLDPETFDRSRMDMERGWRMLRDAEADQSRVLDLRDMPEFRFVPRTIPEAVELAAFDLSILVIMNMLLFAAYFTFFMRYDAR